jgi:hypothetical protein
MTERVTVTGIINENGNAVNAAFIAEKPNPICK